MKNGYKMTPLGEIPASWKLKKLKHLAEFLNGKGHEQFIDDKGDYIVVNSKFISTDGQVKKFSNSNLCPLYKDDIAIVMSDIPNGKAIAKCFLVQEDNKYTLNQRIGCIKPTEVYYKYLYYVLNRNKYYLAFDNGVGQTNLRKDEVIDCPVLTPPLPEQQKIAEILSTVDDKIDVIDQQITETQELKKGLMQRLLTKGIGHTEFKDSPLGEIPKSWELTDLNSILNKGRKITYGIVQPAEHDDCGVYMIRSQDYTKGWNPLSTIMKVSSHIDKPYERSRVRYGDILITVVGANTGRVAVVPPELDGANISRSVARISIDSSKSIPQFIRYYLTSNGINLLLKKNQVGGAQPVINLKELGILKVPMPNVLEQQKIANILSTVDDKLEVLQDKKQEYQELKKGLMQQLLTGKIRVAV